VALPASYPMGTGDSFPAGEADNSPPSNAEIKEWVEMYIHSSNTPSWRGDQLKMHRDNFILLLLLLLLYYILALYRL
jgi:hypothetical protein